MKKQSLKLFTISLIAFVIIISVLLYFFSEHFTRSWLPIDNGFGDSISISPNDDTIIFSFYQSGDAALYQANIDGTMVNQLTYPREDESHIQPRYSNDGRKILFLSQEKGKGEIKQTLYVMDANGSNLTKVTDGEELITDAIFSEDNQCIYYLSAQSYMDDEGPTTINLFKRTLAGGDKQQLTSDNSFKKRSLSLTSSGRKLGYIDYHINKKNEVDSSFVIFDTTTNEKKEIIPEMDYHYNILYSAKISPDGSVIAFSAGSENPREKSEYIYELYTMDLTNNEVQSITSFRTLITEPVFYYGKDRLLFIQDQGWMRRKPNYKLWGVDIEGNDIHFITLQMPQFSGTAL
ncbi:TolB-like translocation protein [Sutcliffiella rhizosphaerae]|uniref:Tol-Pal system protein TolB n=1 Tax=Sutcliffiella rhizosphaerae TaxID=2880967 RepID=A0ABN8A6L7_9BACI|nr:hypothetical protein [Sutcliffiella rhizosphaerae]CAG9619287.1 Tol-Pal system protein TolB [Sutcliffiella rhizosphaerae]